jgi:hypothetical protein
MSDASRSTRFAERLRRAVDDDRTDAVGRRRARGSRQPAFSPTANPDRVQVSDELFVDRLRNALD